MAYSANIIPTMTSATTPSGVASASSYLDSGFEGWRAFDHVIGTTIYWYPSGGTPSYVQYQFIATHVVTRYTITSPAIANDPSTPKAWTFKGSNNGTSWDTLDTQTNISWDAVGALTKTFDIANSTAYAYYRLTVSESNTSFIRIDELEMMETVGGTIPLAAIGSISLAGTADLTGFFAVVSMDASGSIALTGSAGLIGFFPVVSMAADGGVSLAGSASILATGFHVLEAIGTIGLDDGYADLCQWEPMAAVGTIALCGEAWLSDALHGEDTLQAVGAIELRVTAVRLSTGETLPPTDDLGWTVP